MRVNLAKWRPTRLLLAWGAYWVALALVFLGPAMPILWRVTRPDGRGSASASMGDAGIHLSITQGAATVWTLDVSLIALSLWLAVPPLVLWVFWLRAQRRPGPASAMRAT